MVKQKQIIEKAIIKHIAGNRATVEIIKPNPEECKSCGVCAGIENRPNLLEINVIPGARVGQQVTLQVIEYSPYKTMFLILVLPIISLFVGSIVGQKVHFICSHSQNLRTVLCGIIFFVISIAAVGIYDKKIRSKKQAYRKIISIVNNLNLGTR